MKRKTKVLTSVLIFATIITICICLFVSNNKGITALVKSDGNILYKIKLDEIDESYSFEVGCNSGKNTVYLENGKISITEADCPDKLCIKQSQSGIYPIVCLPHRLVIELTNE